MPFWITHWRSVFLMVFYGFFFTGKDPKQSRLDSRKKLASYPGVSHVHSGL
jgi:hypothetical protein